MDRGRQDEPPDVLSHPVEFVEWLWDEDEQQDEAMHGLPPTFASSWQAGQADLAPAAGYQCVPLQRLLLLLPLPGPHGQAVVMAPSQAAD